MANPLKKVVIYDNTEAPATNWSKYTPSEIHDLIYSNKAKYPTTSFQRIADEINVNDYPVRARVMQDDGKTSFGFYRELEQPEKRYNPRLKNEAGDLGGYQYNLVFRDKGSRNVDENQFKKYLEEWKQYKQRNEPYYVPVLDTDPIYSKVKLKDGVAYGKNELVEVEKGELILRKEHDGSFCVVDDFKNASTHEKGGEDYQLQDGDMVVPSNKRKTVEKYLKNNNWDAIEEVRSSLPKSMPLDRELELGLNNESDEPIKQPQIGQLEGIKSFIKDAVEGQGVEYSDEIGDKVLSKHKYDYDKIINEIGNIYEVPEDKRDKYKTNAYLRYNIVKPDEENLAEINFLRTPMGKLDSKTGYERYKQLQEDLKLSESMASKLTQPKEDISLIPEMQMEPSSTRIEAPSELMLDSDLRPGDKQERIEQEYKQRRIGDLTNKINEINTALAEQAKLNVGEFGYASKEHEDIVNKYKAYDSLIQKAIDEKEEKSTTGIVLGQGSTYGGSPYLTTYRQEDREKVKNLKDIKDLYGKMGKILGSPQGSNFEDQVDGLLYGFGNNFFTKDFATLGLSEMSRLLNVKEAFDTYNKTKEQVLSENDYSSIPENEREAAIENDILQTMPSEQKALLDTYKLFLNVQAGSKANFSTAIGEGLKEMIPFIAQFAATGGAGSGAKKLITEFVEAKTKSALTGRIAGAIAKPLIQGALMIPANLQNYAERVAPTMDIEGNLIEGQKPLNAAFKSYLTTVAEVVGEDIGSFTNKWANDAARKSYMKMIANNPGKAQEFLGKMSLLLTADTGVPSVQGFLFEGIGEEATGIMQAAIDQDGSFFTPEAQAQLWVMSLMASGGFASLSAPKRIATKVKYNKAETLLNDIPNEEYVNGIKSLTENIQDPEELVKAFDDVSKQFGIADNEIDYYKARNFIGRSIENNQMSVSRTIRLEQQIMQYQGNDGNVTLANIDGEQYSIRNPEDLGKDGKVIYAKALDGTIKPVISSKITQYETQTPDQIKSNAIASQDQEDAMLQDQQNILDEAEAKGLIQGGTVETPHGKKTLVTVNPDGTATVEDNKGEQSIVNTNEIEPYKTKEQQAADKVEEEADLAVMEGIDEKANVISDEPLTDESDIRVIDFDNGQSKIITPEGEQVFETLEDRDAAIAQLVGAETESYQENLDQLAPDQAFAKMIQEDPENIDVATELFADEINTIRSQSEDLRIQAKEVSSRKEKQALLIQAKQLESEAQRLEAILQDPSLLEQSVQEEADSYIEPTQTVDQLADQLHKEYLQEQENVPFNKLLPWQQQLLGNKINKESFTRFEDPKLIQGTMAKSWFTSKDQKSPSNNIDVLAQELSETSGFDVSPQDIVDFMLQNPSNAVRSTTDKMRDLISEYRELTGKSIKQHVPTVKESASELQMVEDSPLGEAPEAVPFRMKDKAPLTEGVDITDKAQDDVKSRTNAIKELGKMFSKFGIPIKIINSSEMPMDVSEKAREVGGVHKAFYYNGTAYILSDQITSVSDVKKSYLHEAILHKGLDLIFKSGPVTLLGKSYETKNEFLDEVFKRLDDKSIADRARYYLEEGVDLTALTDVQKRELAEEALATLNETESSKVQVILDKLYNYIKKLVGLTSQQFSKADLRNMLREHQELIIKQKQDAEAIRKDERKVPEARTVREEGATKGRQDIQQPTEAGTKAGDTQEQVMLRAVPVKGNENLVVLHNLNEDNIININKVGGLPVPSLAITRVDIPFVSYGDISLIADKSMIDPQGYGKAKTFNTDIYSPRYPSITYDLDYKKFDNIFDEANKQANKYGLNPIDIGSLDIETRGLRELQDREVSMLAYLIENNNAPRPIMESVDVETPLHKFIKKGWVDTNALVSNPEFVKAVTELYEKDPIKSRFVKNGKLNDNILYNVAGKVASANALKIPNSMANRDAIKKRAIGTPAKKQLFNNWLNEAWEDIIKGEKIFKGYTPSGSRRYIPHTLDNVVKELTKGLQGAEGMFYGVGSVRSGAAKQFKTVEEIQADRDKIISSKEMEDLKEEVSNEFTDILEAVKPYYKYDTEGWGYSSAAGESLLEYAKKGRSADFKAFSSGVKREVSDFLNKLKNMPSEYFESKVQRAVGLDEFKAAVVPNNTSKEVLDILDKNGIVIKKYNPKIEGDRTKKVELTARQQDVKFRVAESQKELDDFVKDSKVKDTVYHGTKSNFVDFEHGKSYGSGDAFGFLGKGFYFTNDLMTAESYAGEGVNMEVKLDMKNPFISTDGRHTSPSTQGSFARDLGLDPNDPEAVSDYLKKQGYDGVIAIDETDDYREYMVFDNSQILIEPKEDVKFRVEEERQKVEENPTEAQKEAGNYSMGHIKVDGFDITIENPKGSIRSGRNQEGEEWSNVMPADYGYFKGTIGKDKDHIDVFMGDNLESDKVYVVDQVDPETGKFDEHKVMMGYDSLSEAKKAYMDAYDEGWEGLGTITRTTKDGLKEWFNSDTKKPFAPELKTEKDVKFRLDLPPRLPLTKVRGGWTKDKIIKELKYIKKTNKGSYGKFNQIKGIAEYDDASDLRNHLFYHGTGSGVSGALYPSITLSERDAERYGGGGYGERYYAVSVSKSKKKASAFSGQSRGVSIYPVLLNKDAKVIDRPDLQDSNELEEIIEELWNQGVDAVRLGDWNEDSSEQELAIINPIAISTWSSPEYHNVFGMKLSDITEPTDDELNRIISNAKRSIIDFSEWKDKNPSPTMEGFEEYWERTKDMPISEKSIEKEKRKNIMNEYNSLMRQEKEKYVQDIKFRATSSDPEIQKMLDKLQEVERLSKTAAAIKRLEQKVKNVSPKKKQTIIDKIAAFKAGANLSESDTKAMINEVQKTITNYAKKVLPLTESGAREISYVLTVIKDSQTPESLESALKMIDELAGITTEKTERRKAVSKVNRLLAWMTGLKKSGARKVGKFNYEDTKQFEELRDINKQSIDLVKKTNSWKATAEEKIKAESDLDQLWEKLNTKESKTDLDNTMMKLIELRRLGSKASPKLAQIVSEELEAIYKVAKDAKSASDMVKSLSRKQDKEFIESFLEDNKSLKDHPWFKKAMTQINSDVADVIGNWETLLIMIGGNKLRDKMSFMLHEADMETGKQETNNRLLDAAKTIYGSSSKTGTLNKIHELSENKYTLRQPNRRGEAGKGDPMELSKLHLMDIYNALKNEDIERDYYMAYGEISIGEDGSRDIEAQKADGKETIDALVGNLSVEDKQFADKMQEELDKYYDKLNEIHIKLYNRDLPRVENYWPSTAEREQDIDVMEQFFIDSRHPSATKERNAHRIPTPKDAFNKFTRHVDEAEWYTNMSIPAMEANRVFKDNNIKSLINDARGKNFYKNIEESLQNVTLMPPGKMRQNSKLNSLLNPILNNWVTAKIGATPSVPLKQLLSAINYAENMPAKKWVKGFIKGLSSPKSTWNELMQIPYLKARIGNGYSEAVQRALNGDENVHKSKASNYHQAFKKWMTIGTAYGDITAIIFGGKPYLDYLIKDKGLSEKEAVDQFLQDTLRSQQAPFASTLSKLQNSKNPFLRAFFTFSNTTSQYMRKLFEANQNLRVQQQQYEKGKISKEELNKTKKQTIKAHTIYGLINTVTFTMTGALVNSMMKGSDPDDEIWKDMLAQLSATYVGGLPIIKDILSTATRQTLGMKIYDDVNPYIEALDGLITEGIKLSRGEGTDKSIERVMQSASDMLGIPYYNLKKDIKAIPPFREETISETRVKEVNDKLNKLFKGDKVSLSSSAKEMKDLYKKAKYKSTLLKKEGEFAKADKLEKSITKSKNRLWETDFENNQIKNEAKMFSKLVDMID